MVKLQCSYKWKKHTANQTNLSLSIRLRFRSCSSRISFSAALMGADRFFSFADALSLLSPTPEVANVLRTFGRFRGLAPGFKGFALNPPKEMGAAVAAGFADNERTTLSAPSSRLRPSSAGGELEEDGPASTSAAARSICSAISWRSRCSSDIVARSFFKDAS